MSPAYETINPWAWQDQFGFSQAVATPTPSRWLFLAGQGPAAADGSVVSPGDIGGQLTQAFDNLETVLAQAGSDLSHVVRLTYYTTDVDALLGVWAAHHPAPGRQPTGQHPARRGPTRVSRDAHRDRGNRSRAVTPTSATIMF